MLRATFARVTTAAGGIATALWCLAAPAAAQNYDAGLQVRFGSFLQGAAIRGNAAMEPTAGNDGPFSYFSKGIGVASGLEYVTRRGWNFGIEVDAAFMDGRTNALGQQFGIDYIVTARGRIGAQLRPDILLYATGGPALRGSDLNTTQTNVGTNTTGLKFSRSNFGWSAGGGVEWDYGGGILFAEYLYSDFGQTNITEAVTPRDFHYNADAHMFRLGLKFKVGHDHYHDDVAERIGRRGEPLK